MDEVIREYRPQKFKGKVPDVPTYDDVDTDALFEGDDNPFLITLPIMRVGEVSRNGMHYTEALVSEVEKQLPGLGGIRGHIPKGAEDSAFPLEDVDWIGHTRIGEYTWAKGYIPPGETRQYVKRVKARGGGIATSIYGRHGGVEKTDKGWTPIAGKFALEQVDLAPVKRASRKTDGEFAVTREMVGEEMTREEIIAELTASDIPNNLRQQIIKQAKVETDAGRVSELEGAVTERDTRITEITQERDNLKERVAELERVRLSGEVNTRIAELTNWNVNGEEAETRVKSLRRLIHSAAIAKLQSDATDETIAETLQSVWDDEFKVLAEALRDSLAGPAAAVGGKASNREDWRDKVVSEENRDAIRETWGI